MAHFKFLANWMFIFLCIAVTSGASTAPYLPPQKEDVAHWNNLGQDELKATLEYTPNTNVARNVILFVGDGMGVTTLTGSRILKGQLKQRSGEEEQLSFEKFPYSAMIKVYNTDAQVPDSAGTATAFLSGVKTRRGRIGVGPGVPDNNCTAAQREQLSTILDWSRAEGKSVGIVTTTRLTHATPAAAYAHVPNRYWEGDASIGPAGVGCRDIALQLVEDNPDIQVLLGGGRRYFIPNDEPDPVTGVVDKNNGRRDSRNLIEEWKADKAKRKKARRVVFNQRDLNLVDTRHKDYLLGLFNPSYMNYASQRPTTGPTAEPSIAKMTQKAIEVLQKNPKGYFLLVEGGRIDHGHHAGRARRAFSETLAFDEAVEKAVEMTNQNETLIVVTADHSHTLAMGGFPGRGNPIFGLDFFKASDGKPMTTLLYGFGPGHKSPREDLTNVDTASDMYRQQSAVPLGSGTHGMEDVTAHAIGPMSHLFRGVKEQNYLAHAMAYASCVGQNKAHCKPTD
ncbi:alkaline phosphatase, tissue-nonspecific isozyme-like [Liolophura sinensis]|uniref:alkaline phosphatase, tissue-nonspecific isozyme-like n=1 Tax=Liolophura sinensis TaxID=3198878 RepID=UPI0031596CE1